MERIVLGVKKKNDPKMRELCTALSLKVWSMD